MAELVNGEKYDPNNPTDEPNFDIEYAQAIMVCPTPLSFYSRGNNSMDSND